MKKIMFNDKYGLTKAVLEGKKTMTRRLVPDSFILDGFKSDDEKMEYILSKAQYKVGDIVAISQCYEDLGFDPEEKYNGKKFKDIPAWTNKMFVKAELMHHFIEITDLKAEYLKDISDEDALREGVFIREDLANTHLKNIAKYTFYGMFDGDIWTCYKTPREAFSTLIDLISGKGTWDRNPLVYGYSFKLSGLPLIDKK